MSSNSSDFKLDRKTLKQPDPFASSLRGVFSELSKHQKLLLSVCIGVVAMSAVGAYLYNRREQKNQAGMTELYLADKTLEGEIKKLQGPAPTSTPTAAKGAEDANSKATELAELEFKKLSVDSTFPETVKKLKDIASHFGKSRVGFDARMKLGNLYFNHGAYEQALPWYQDTIGKASNKLEKALALSALGYAHENMNKPQEAIESFQKALDLGEGSLKGDLLLAIARCYEALHDVAKAKATYDRILSDLPTTDYAKNAEMYKAQL